MSITSLVTGLLFVPIPLVSTETFGGNTYTNYTFIGDGAGLNTSYVQNTEYDIAEIAFAGGPLAPPATVRASSYPDGGTNGQSYFYMALGGTQTVNRSNQYYGTGATNTTFETGYSFVPLGNVTLPTKFSHFLAVKKDDNAELTWTVETEENNAYFDVQRSLDGRLFTDAIRVQAYRNGRTSNTYSTPDLNISRLGSKVIYYRIKQVETSGEIVYSEVRQISLTTKNFTIGLYPNPVVNSTKLVVDAPEAGKAYIIVRDALGKAVQQISMDFVKGINQKDLNATMLPAGEYNVTVMGEKFNQTIKMTKTN
ncbi:MAG: T9SS type A sorting domain-containing protein [Bacteroidota bacterium]